MNTDGCIASPHWDACEDCDCFEDQAGCTKQGDITMSLYLGDWILCDDFEPKEEDDGTSRQ